MLVQEREVRGRDRNILVDDEYKHGAVDEWCKAPVSVTRLLEDRHVRLCRKATVAADVRKRRVRRVQLGNPRDKLQENCMSACLEMHVSWVKKGCGEGSDGGRRSKAQTMTAAMIDTKYGASTKATQTHLRLARSGVSRVRVVRTDLLARTLPLEVDRLARGRKARLVV